MKEEGRREREREKVSEVPAREGFGLMFLAFNTEKNVSGSQKLEKAKKGIIFHCLQKRTQPCSTLILAE